MRTMNATTTDPGFITLCIELAQATFAPSMPADGRAQPRRAASPPVPDKPSLMAKIGDWMYRLELREREAYLAASTDVFDLERRIRHLERRPAH